MEIKLSARGMFLMASLGVVGPMTDAAKAIVVPNFSFEEPGAPDSVPYATDQVDSWVKTGVQQASGTFYNTPNSPPIVDNAQGNNLGFIFANPGTGFHQELLGPDRTYLVGNSYQLTVGAEGGGGMPVGALLEFRLYYLTGTAGETRTTIASSSYVNNNTGAIDHLADTLVTVPTVTINDAWHDKQIGIEIISVDSPTVTESGYFDIDNVRLVPEPTAIGSLAALAAAAALKRPRRQQP